MSGAWDHFPPPGVIRQITGTPLSGLNCAAATGAMSILSERQGRKTAKGPWPPTADNFRAATGDRVGGLLASQVDETSNRVWGVDPDFQIASAALVGAKLDDGYGLHLLHRYGPIQDAGFNGSSGFRENHSAFVSNIRGEGASLAVKDCDPLFDGRHPNTPQGPQWLPWHSFVRAAELLVILDDGTRMIDRYGPGMLFVGFTRVPYRPGVPISYMRYSVAFGAGSFYVYDVSPGGVITKRHARQFSKPTSARCGAPSVYPWPGNPSRRLVRMAAGALKGQYVAVNQGSAKLIEKEVST